MVPDAPDPDEEEEEFPQASRRTGSTLAAPAIARNLRRERPSRSELVWVFTIYLPGASLL
jgi:hypothetical protein